MSNDQITQEQVLQQAAEAMSAVNELKNTLTEVKSKADAFDEAKLTNLTETITKAAENSQKLERSLTAAEKAFNDRVASLEASLKEAVDGGEASTKEITELKATLQRMSLAQEKEGEAERKTSNRAMNEFARKDNPSRTYMSDYLATAPDEIKTLSVNSNPDGGYLSMPVLEGLVTTRVIESSPIRDLATVRTIGKDTLEFPTYNDRAVTGGWVVEEQTRPATATPKFGKQTIGAFEQYAMPAVTQKMIDDADIDIEAFLIDELSKEFARVENTAFVSGDGVEKPKGFLSYGNYTTPGVFEQGKIERIKSGVNGGFAYDGLVDLQNGLKEPYQGNARFFCKRATFGALMKLKDGESRPIFNMVYDKNTGLATGIMGKPVVFGDDMPALATSALALAYGDFRQAYLIVDRIGVRILRDPLTQKGFVLFYTTKRTGGDIVNFEAIKLQNLNA
ncbi:MAG: phage major capsid protein [Acetobacteraceae bacterium]